MRFSICKSPGRRPGQCHRTPARSIPRQRSPSKPLLPAPPRGRSPRIAVGVRVDRDDALTSGLGHVMTGTIIRGTDR